MTDVAFTGFGIFALLLYAGVRWIKHLHDTLAVQEVRDDE